MATSRVVVLGGSGLIGRAVLAAWSTGPDGRELVVMSRNPAELRGLPARVRAAAWQPTDPASFAHELDGAAAVLNLAGENIAAGRWTAARKKVLVASRVEVGRAVAAACAAVATPPRVLLQASAVGYYGDTGGRDIDESAPPASDFLGRLAVDWEAATAPVETLGVRRVVLRTGVVLAREGGALAKLLPVFRWGLGGPLGSGEQAFPWIHIADQVAAMSFLLDCEAAAGPFNLVAPEVASNRQLASALGSALGRPAWLPAPTLALRLALGEMADMLLSGQRALPTRLLDLGYRFRFPSLAAALDNLVAA